MTETRNPQRLFFALAPPPDEAKKLDAIRLQGLAVKSRTTAADMHITLRYLGDVEAARIEDICSSARAIKRAPFQVNVRGLGFFEKPHQTILYAHVESVRQITALCADLTDRLMPYGFDFGTRPLRPHITMARLKNKKNLHDFIEKFARQVYFDWKASSFLLMESGPPDQSGARYRIKETFPLRS